MLYKCNSCKGINCYSENPGQKYCPLPNAAWYNEKKECEWFTINTTAV
jgi:hypothetical protein